MPIFLGKLVGIEVFPRRLPAGDEEQMIAEQTARVGQREDGIKKHGESQPLLCAALEAGSEGDVVAFCV
jgi:hypothetical protein